MERCWIFGDSMAKKKTGDFLKNTATLVGLMGVLFSVYFFVDGTYAEKTELVAVSQRVTFNELYQLLRSAQENLHFYRQQHRKYPIDPKVEGKLEKAEEEVKDLKDRIKNLKEKKDEQ